MLKNPPKVTVAIALYKATYLDSLFDTLKSQTYKNIEYIISNDRPNNSSTKNFAEKNEKRIQRCKNIQSLQITGCY